MRYHVRMAYALDDSIDIHADVPTRLRRLQVVIEDLQESGDMQAVSNLVEKWRTIFEPWALGKSPDEIATALAPTG